ncbi:hypothetical protein C7M61_003638 [Candidozyma pseudohaemuli]|uniref:Uncharacterized protein n=1 Tax=Candidozyma pseudohaemuli TaxID=418784 RepID=A0A2P7YML0_9ASCO|nr:hypothetical protein C7M61_003638 [[Candida] pseudohaemulonii]PSK37211.1 hypothetical protein C7M61_003638 [[Candida] pseudohaemulonii]
MALKHTDSGIAAAVFLALYAIYALVMVYIVHVKGFKTVYTFLMSFPFIRLGSQFCGLVFAIKGIEHYKWLIAYLVLGAEGYFVLILSAFSFLVHAQKRKIGYSWLEKKQSALKDIPLGNSYAAIFHWFLVPANAMVIAGGSMLTGIENYDAERKKVRISKGLRTAGQSLFLCLTLLVLLLGLHAFKKEKVGNSFNITILLASPFLIVRGVFGILSIYIENMNYYQLSNYSGAGINHKLVIYEYVLSTTMEFAASIFIVSNFFFEKQADKDADKNEEKKKKRDLDDESFDDSLVRQDLKNLNNLGAGSVDDDLDDDDSGTFWGLLG